MTERAACRTATIPHTLSTRPAPSGALLEVVALDRIARAARRAPGLPGGAGVLAALVLVVAACTTSTPSSAPAPTPTKTPAEVATEVPTSTPASTDAPTSAPTDAPTAAPTAAPTPTPAPTATPTPAPVAWQKHTSKRFQYAIAYPPGWIVTPGDATHADQFDAFNYPYIYVSRDTVGGSASVALTVTDIIRTTKSHYKARVTANRPIRLAGGYSGRIVTFKGKDGTVPVTIQKIFVAKGREGYFLSMYADNATVATGADVFERMYRSWRPR